MDLGLLAIYAHAPHLNSTNACYVFITLTNWVSETYKTKFYSLWVDPFLSMVINHQANISIIHMNSVLSFDVYCARKYSCLWPYIKDIIFPWTNNKASCFRSLSIRKRTRKLDPQQEPKKVFRATAFVRVVARKYN